MANKRGGTHGRRSEKQLRPMRDSHDDTPLSRERIAATAIELLDAAGVDGLTMRGLADRLGSGVMSLYWHIDNKEDVLDLALDSVLEYHGPQQSTGARDWREEAVHMLEDWRTSMLHHPWSVSLLPRRALGPSILGRLELLSKTLSKAGVADPELNVAIWALWNHVMGATISKASFDLSGDNESNTQQHLALLSERFPAIGRTRLLLDDDWDGAFRKGLDFLFDGIERDPKSGTRFSDKSSAQTKR